jgi:hypothetical protein
MSWGALLVSLGVTAVTVAVLILATFTYADYVSRTSGFFPWPPRRPAPN